MYIYKVTNKLNDKIYIGQTKQPIEKRFKQHAKAYSPLGRAIRKYGIENFKIEVIETCKTFTELNEREIYWIAFYDCKVPKGYNISDGGSFYAVQKVDEKYYIVKTDEDGECTGFFLLKDKYIDKFHDKRYFIDFDEKTGDIKGYLPLKEKRSAKDWLALFRELALWLAKQRMTSEQYRVILVLLSKLDFDSYLRVSNQDIAEFLKIAPPRVSRTMKILKEKNIILEGPPAGLNKTYRLNPYVAHKGANRDNTIIDFNNAFKDKNEPT